MSKLEAGFTLGHLKIVRELGSGGMADVYEAEDSRLGRRVALKVLPPELTRNASLIQRFEKEVRSSATLSHPNIVTLFEFGHEHPYHYYTMRLLTGGDLRQRINAGMELVDIMKVMRAMADAFHHAHNHGLVHRDVKPENILFDEQGAPVLTDFGIAKAMDSSTRMTQTGMSVGTPRYISPEQARGQLVDGRADLYSLGCIFHEMLTGEVPFDANEPLAVIFKHVTEPIPKLPAEYASFQHLFEKLMAKEPADRYADAAELRDALDEVVQRDWTGEIKAALLEEVLQDEVPAPGRDDSPTLITPQFRERPREDEGATQLSPLPDRPLPASEEKTTRAADVAQQARTQIARKQLTEKAAKKPARQAPVKARKKLRPGRWIPVLLLLVVAGGLAWILGGRLLGPAEAPPAQLGPSAEEVEAERRALEQQRQQAAEAEQQRQAELQRQREAEAARQRAEEEQQRAEAERLRQQQAEQERLRAEEAARARAAEEAAQRQREQAEAERRQRAAEEARKREQAARRKAEQERLAREAEAERKRQAEEAARKREQEEAQRLFEAERLRQQEEDARRQQEAAEEDDPFPIGF